MPFMVQLAFSRVTKIPKFYKEEVEKGKFHRPMST